MIIWGLITPFFTPSNRAKKIFNKNLKYKN